MKYLFLPMALIIILIFVSQPTFAANYNYNNLNLPKLKVGYIKPLVLIKKKIIPEALKQRVSIKGRLNLGSIFYMLSLDSHINFSYSKNVNINKKMTVIFYKKPLYKVLSVVLSNYVYHYNKYLNKIDVHGYENKTYRFSVTALTNSVSFSVGSTSSSSVSGNSHAPTGSTGGSSGGPQASGNPAMMNQNSTNPAGSMSDNMSTPSMSFYRVLNDNLKIIFKGSKKSYYNIYPSYGLLIVHSKKKKIRQVNLFAGELNKLLDKKIILTVKILDISLSNQYQFGINMQQLFQNALKSNALGLSSVNLSLNSGTQSGANNSGDYLSFTGNNSNQAVINALQTFGNVKLVNSAVLSVLNGQTRVISSGEVIPYESGVQIESLGLSNSTLSYPQISQVQVGLSISFTPLIMGDKVYATVAVVDNDVAGYSSFSANGNNFSVPNVDTKTMVDTFAVKSNTSVLLGGLTTNETNNNKYGVPILDDIPIIGYLFSGINNASTKTEIYILLKPKIIK